MRKSKPIFEKEEDTRLRGTTALYKIIKESGYRVAFVARQNNMSSTKIYSLMRDPKMRPTRKQLDSLMRFFEKTEDELFPELSIARPD